MRPGMGRLPAALLVATFAALAAVPAYGQGDASGRTEQSRRAGQAVRDMRVSQLTGREVKDARGESLGEVKDVIVDVNNERVHYLVLGFGRVLGDKLFAYPVGAFEQAAGDELILDVDRERLKKAPGFDKWPDWSKEARYRREVERHFGHDATKYLPNDRLMRAAEVIGRKVKDRDGKGVGQVEDMVVNLGSGRVRYVALELERSWKLNDQLVALPLRALRFGAERGDEPTLGVARSQIDTRRAFAKNDWPDINDPDYLARMDGYLRNFGRPGAAQRGVGPTTEGMADREGAGRGAAASFRDLDRNRDRYLDRNELRRHPEYLHNFKRLDRDGDQRLSREEFDAAHR